MTEFDKKIRELSKKPDIPVSYDERLDDILNSIREKEAASPKKKRRRWTYRTAICLIVILVGLLSVGTFHAEANVFDFFKKTIMNFLGMDTEEDMGEKGVGSNQVYIRSKPELMIELKETVIDKHNIYLLVQVTAPADIVFREDIGFDYFCFCKGENYSVNQLLGGSRDCKLLEVSQEKPNMATYVVSMVSDEELSEGSYVTASFKDLEIDPFSEEPEILVEGMWSVSFPVERTVTESISIQGEEDMIFSYINTTATVESLELMPSGLVLTSDVSNFPYDQLGLSDTTIAITLEMIDGSRLVVVSHDTEEEMYIQGGSISFNEIEGRSYQQDTLEFKEMINISKVTGIYIEELYIPVRR